MAKTTDEIAQEVTEDIVNGLRLNPIKWTDFVFEPAKRLISLIGSWAKSEDDADVENT